MTVKRKAAFSTKAGRPEETASTSARYFTLNIPKKQEDANGAIDLLVIPPGATGDEIGKMLEALFQSREVRP